MSSAQTSESSSPVRVIETRPGAVSRAGGIAASAGIEKHPVHADRSAQRGVVRHRVGARAGGEGEAEVEQAVPDLGGGLVVGETDHFQVIDLAVDDIRRQGVAQH